MTNGVGKASILRGRKSKALAGTGELTVRDFDGVLRVSEEEAEISYIDELIVHAKSVTGENVTIPAADERLAHVPQVCTDESEQTARFCVSRMIGDFFEVVPGTPARNSRIVLWH